MSGANSRGILTETDKEWLLGEIEYNQRQTAAHRRAQIRDRVAAALQDFAYLNDHWPEKERRQTLDETDDPEATAAEIIKFLYIWLNERATDPNEMANEDGVNHALSFRRALSRGIAGGKQHFGHDPNYLLIDSNEKLFELPSIDDLKRNIDTKQWRDLNDHTRGAIGESDDTLIDQNEAAKQFHAGLQLAIAEKLYIRRGSADSEVQRNDQMIASSIPLPDKKSDDKWG